MNEKETVFENIDENEEDLESSHFQEPKISDPNALLLQSKISAISPHISPEGPSPRPILSQSNQSKPPSLNPLSPQLGFTPRALPRDRDRDNKSLSKDKPPINALPNNNEKEGAPPAPRDMKDRLREYVCKRDGFGQGLRRVLPALGEALQTLAGEMAGQEVAARHRRLTLLARVRGKLREREAQRARDKALLREMIRKDRLAKGEGQEETFIDEDESEDEDNKDEEDDSFLDEEEKEFYDREKKNGVDFKTKENDPLEEETFKPELELGLLLKQIVKERKGWVETTI